jgi:hypothetical protein
VRSPTRQRPTFGLLSKAETDVRYRFELAERLHMTVARMEQEMSVVEFLCWQRLDKVRAKERELAEQSRPRRGR